MATLLLPLYVYPADKGAAWSPLFEAARKHPHSKVLVIINPENGPGTRRNQDYDEAVGHVASAGLPMAGYVYTSYGGRTLESVEEEVLRWSSLYPEVKQIFVDNVANEPGLERYYSRLSRFASSKGFEATIGNPGIQIPRSYFGTFDVTVIYEQAGYPRSPQALDPEGWYHLHPEAFGMIVHSVDRLEVRFIEQAAAIVQFICVTQRYEAFPPYLENLLACLGDL